MSTIGGDKNVSKIDNKITMEVDLSLIYPLNLALFSNLCNSIPETVLVVMKLLVCNEADCCNEDA